MNSQKNSYLEGCAKLLGDRGGALVYEFGFDSYLVGGEKLNYLIPNWDDLVKKKLRLRPGEFNKNKNGHPYWVPEGEDKIEGYYKVCWKPIYKQPKDLKEIVDTLLS